MELLARLKMMARQLVEPFVMLDDQRSVFSYAAAILFVLFSVMVSRTLRKNKNFRFKALGRLLFRKSVWLHKSSILDYKFFILVLPMMTFVFGIFILGAEFWADLFGRGFAAIGTPVIYEGHHWSIAVLIAVVLLLAFDFGYWVGHTALHKIGFLWEFHKVHHSAEVMTPATEYRQHPVEFILIPCCTGFTTGLAYALVTHLCGDGIRGMGLIGYNLILSAHILTFHHIRHSHIYLPFDGALGYVFHSPAHHHLHHSADPRHFDKNMGYFLSIWDWMAGTLIIPKRNERYTLGIGEESKEHSTIVASVWLPVVKAWRVLVGGKAPDGASSASEARA